MGSNWILCSVLRNRLPKDEHLNLEFVMMSSVMIGMYVGTIVISIQWNL